MSGIARDGELGDLGRDRLGDAGTGVSEETTAAFLAALNELSQALDDLARARNEAAKAAQVVMSWASVGQKALAVAEPFLMQWAAERERDANAPKPDWAARLESTLTQLGTLQTRFSAFL